MTERWENELHRLREIQMPERVRLRADEEPRGDGMPPRPHRVVAAVVAFSVFAVAGAFAWRAFLPASVSTLGGSGLSTATVSFLASDPEHPEVPHAEMSFGGITIEGQVESFEWQTAGGVSIFDAVAPEFREPLRIEPETLIEVQGDAESVSGRVAVVVTDAPFPWEPTDALDLVSGSAEVRLEPGSYALAFTATWSQGSPTFWFPIQVVESAVQASEDASVIEVTRDPLGATLTFGDQVQQGIVTDVWEPTGEPDDGHRVVLPEFEDFASLVQVPPGTGLEVVGEIDGWTVFPQPEFDVVRLSKEPGPALFTLRTGWHGVEFDVAFGIKVVEPSSGSTQQEPTSAKRALKVRCIDGEAVLDSTSVIAQSDGLHIVPIDVPDDVSIALTSSAESDTSWWSGDNGVDDEFVYPVPPGRLTVICASVKKGDEQTIQQWFDDHGAQARLDDPEGHFIAYTPECSPDELNAFRWNTFGVDPDNAFTRIREVVIGLEPSDLVEAAGYPADDFGGRQEYRIVRQGSIVARVTVGPQGGGAAYGLVCPGTGIVGDPLG